MGLRHSFISVICAALVSACGESDPKLVGERIDIRPDMVAPENISKSVGLGAAIPFTSWTHRNGNAAHSVAMPIWTKAPELLFAIDIGEGDSRRARITADPVIANSVVYTLDARARVTATGTGGGAIWTADVTPGADNASDASGGGLAYGDGTLFVTTGFGEITALDAASGQEIWTQDLDAPGTAAPTVFDGLVYVVARNGTAWALNADTGRIAWQLDATATIASFGGGAGVAVNKDIAIFPFPSGEIIGTFPKGGLRRWSNVISGERLGRVSGLINDISSDPVISGNRAYVGNLGGQLAALSLADGERIWTAAEGALGPVWPAGNAVFFVNDLNELVRLDAADGGSVWRVQLPQTGEKKFGRKPVTFAHYGPILAGGRLVVTSTDGKLRMFDPASGASVGTLDIPGGAATAPAVANGALFVVSKEGQLLSFR